MSETLLDKLEFRNRVLHLKAVWQELHDHLGKFIDTDAIPAKLGITSTAEEMVVPQEIIESVRNTIKTGQLASCENNIAQLNEMKVEDHVEQKNGSGSKSKAKEGSKVRKGKGKSLAGRKRPGKAKGTSRPRPNKAKGKPSASGEPS